MEMPGPFGTPALNGNSNEMLQFNHYLPTADTDIHPKPQLPLLPPQSLPEQTAHHNGGSPDQVGTDGSNPQRDGSFINFRVSKASTNGGFDDGAISTERISRDFDTDTNHDTPNDSMTSASLLPSNHKKSTSPSNPVHTYPPTSSFGSPNVPDSKADYAKFRPRSSIPARLSAAAYAQQCIAAAYASRLNPYALHKKEQDVLQDHLCHLHVTVYLNIRNGILRLWTRNPMVSVSKDEALGCAKDYRWMNLASFAYEWLIRNGYINFGCVEVPIPLVPPKRGRRKDGPVIVVIGAGMAGLGCARHLEGLFNHYRDVTSTEPRVVVLEGRRRIGGRIYSHPLQSLKSSDLPPGIAPKAEMGAQIIVGFDQGNPLDQLVRGQLALPYHLLRDISTIYDIDGLPVDEVQDAMDERLYNDVLDRSGLYRHNSMIPRTAEGDRELIDSGRDLSASDGLTVRQYEEARAAGTIGLLKPTKRVRRGVGHKTADIKTTGPPMVNLGPSEEHPTALACQTMGWKLNSGISLNDTLNLDTAANSSQHPTLGAAMDEGIKQYQRMLPLNPKDMRLLNWHLANLEYANAANVGKLSLSGWDQDMGNEFDGEHSQVIGGYQQVPYGLYSLPDKLDVHTNRIASKISYDPIGNGQQKTMIHCEDGESIAADRVVFTGSLGVLKNQHIEFSPPLPDWKLGAIDRLGFGVMNKVILVFNQPFWDIQRDMFGLLRQPTNHDSLTQEDYSANRGRSYLFWNCLKTTGLPVLIALMVGDAAHHAERIPDAELVTEVTNQLRNVFKHATIPDPLETIVTRWGTDRFTRGSYSYVAAKALPGDYDLMATPIGNLHFAGEATCGTHPATVHGAYLSGLRAASEVIDTVVGPIEIPEPLVPDKNDLNNPLLAAGAATTTATGQKRKEPPSSTETIPPPPARSNSSFIPAEKALRGAYHQAMLEAIYTNLGHLQPRPAKSGLNPFLLYQKDYWPQARTQADVNKRTNTKNPNAKAARDEVRQVLGLMWRQAAEEIKRPYMQQTEANRRSNQEAWEKWQRDTAEWERRSVEVKERWCSENPFESWQPFSSNVENDGSVSTNGAGAGTGTDTETNGYGHGDGHGIMNGNTGAGPGADASFSNSTTVDLDPSTTTTSEANGSKPNT